LSEFKAVRDSLEKSVSSVKHSSAYLQADWDLFIQEAAQIQSALAETMQENEALHEQIKEMEDQQELLQLQIIQNPNGDCHDDDGDPMALSMDHNTPSSSSVEDVHAADNNNSFSNRYLNQAHGNSETGELDMITDCIPRQDVSCQTDASLDGLLLMARSMAFQSKILNDQVIINTDNEI
jgi:hypothetical protein